MLSSVHCIILQYALSLICFNDIRDFPWVWIHWSVWFIFQSAYLGSDDTGSQFIVSDVSALEHKVSSRQTSTHQQSNIHCILPSGKT